MTCRRYTAPWINTPGAISLWCAATTAATSRSPADEVRANARLIAAAPELLAALKEVAEGCESRLRKGKDAGDLNTLRLCRAAITKAEGRTA